ncbi:MAG: fibronectin type III domain-containing protein, partial [Prevotella sp.]|nr:fibronectin type III domain-containing protein [Prevotella sp.]
MLLVAALLVPWVTNAQTTTLTVADGTETNSYIPIYGLWADADQHNQIVYPATMLNDLGGGMITGMTFYMSSPASSAWGGSVTVSITEVSGTTVTSILPTTGATEVWTGTVNGNTSTWAITFTTPYTYGGGNLLIDIDYVTADDYSSCSWTGISQTNASYCTYNGNTYAQNFLPKVTFEYAPAGDFCFAPSNLTATVDDVDADITWVDTNASQWQVTWGIGTFNPDTVFDNTDFTTSDSYSFSNMEDGIYTVYVRSICGAGDTSSWRSTTFMIGGCFISIAGIDSYGDGWNGGSVTVMQNGVELADFTFTSGSNDSIAIPVVGNAPVTFSWNSGNYDSEVSFKIYDGSGVMMHYESTPSAGLVYTMTSPCPTCIASLGLVATNVTPDSIYVQWTAGNATSWLVSNGVDTVQVDIDNYYAFGELTPNTVYTITLNTLCDDGDTSGTVAINVRTACVPIDSLPWTQDFEDSPTGTSTTGSPFAYCMERLNNGTSYGGYPYVESSSSYNHTPGGNKGLYWYNTNTTGTYGDYQIVVMPGLDPEYISLDTLQFKFWAKSSSSDYFPDFQVGVMTNPNDPASFTQVASINVGNSTEWHEYIVPLGTYEGTGRYIALRALRASNYWYAYVDDLTIEGVPNCPPVVDLTVAGVTTQYASLQWDYMRGIIEDEPSTYTVELVEVGSTNSPTTQTTSDPYIVLSGLTPGTQYKAFVSVDCGGESGAPDSVEFTTVEFGCIGLSENMIGDPNSTSNNYTVPVNNYYRNTMSQQLIMANELGSTPGYIRSVSFDYYYSSPSTVKNDCEIWIGLTSLSSLSTSQLLDTSQMTKVYAGPLNCTQGWNTFSTMQLDSVYYPGDTNVVICVIDNSNDYNSSSYTFRTTAATGKTVAYYSDSYNYYTNPGSMTHMTYSYRSNMIITIGECQDISTCAAPAAWVTNVARDSVRVEWIPGASETSWNVYVDSMGTMVYVANTTDTYYEFSGLNASTDYTFYVENDCDNETFVCSVSATTLPDDAWDVMPFVCTFDSTDMDGVWQRVNNNQTNKWCIGMAGDSRALMISDDGVNNTYNISSTSASHAYARINLPAGEYAYSFDWRAVGESSLDYILAYVVPDSYTPVAGSYNVPGNAIRIDGGSYLNQSSSWQTRSDIINIADSGVYKVVFTWRNDGSVGTMPPAGIDNVMIARNTCPRPASIILDSVTTTTATFHWVDNSTATTGGYKIEYNGVVDYTTSTNYTAISLSPSTGYTFRVYSICDNDDTSMAITLHAFTACGDVMVPYLEDFESFTAGTSSFPQCWTNFSNTSNYVQATYGVNSSNALHFAGPGVVVTPRIAIEGNRILLNCWLRAESTTSSGTMHIGFTTNPTTLSDYVEITEIQPNTTLTYYSDIYFDSATSDTGYVVFKQDPNASTIYYWWLDEVNIVDMGTCPRPNNLTASNATSSSVDLSWADRGTPLSWVIEYGPTGFTQGTGTVVAASSNPFTLTGIPASYQGEFYVRAVCGGGDSSDYSTTPGRFSTTQIPATLPYNYDFENDAEWANWQHSTNNASYDWYRGTAANTNGNTSQYSMYVSADQGVTYRPYTNNAIVNAAVYRDVDFGPTQSSFTVTFDARAGGTISARYDALMVFLVDPAIPTVASDQGITSPWGNVNDLYRIALVYLDTNWNTYTASFDTISGVKRVAFFWFNQNTPSYASYPEAAAVDNIHIEESACPRPVGTTIDAVGATTASISWMGPSPATYEVIYRPYPNGTSNTYVQTSTNSITLTGLEPMTQYAVWVRKLCTGDTSLTSDGVLFTTDMCDNATNFYNFVDSTMTSTTSQYAPIGYSTYNYSYVQTIIDSAFIADLQGDITAFAFNVTTASAGDYFTGMDVYMANVSESSLSGFITPDSAHQFVQVISNGDFGFTDVGWQIFGFDTTFTWDGHSNILFAVNRNHGSWSSGAYFAAHNTTGASKTYYAYQDSGPISITAPSADYGNTTLAYTGDIQLISCGGGCAKPTLLPVSDLSYNTATINWNSNATDFEVSVKAATDGVWPAEIAVSNATSYVVNNLQPATPYQYRVRAICDATE